MLCFYIFILVIVQAYFRQCMYNIYFVYLYCCYLNYISKLCKSKLPKEIKETNVPSEKKSSNNCGFLIEAQTVNIYLNCN
ncbi:hypothetical protein FDF74_02870 [Clostridium niameyense]|uniref:Uncharacterized protein n=1 Tax=Clostridium niameyense TaxID=1622073 RepID=A0A6M0R7F3_9CLOT|nr:hypothetical protein [Clostridium niameyense]NEZ46152.1 hypothetical protein [Clostridium niameyense]